MDIKDYKFNVGDKVITIYGEVGQITSICTCENCAERGFFEPTWITDDGYEHYITHWDAKKGFTEYYQIGSYHFHDFNNKEVLWEIEHCKKRIEQLEKQLKVIENAGQEEYCSYCKNGTYRKSFHQWDGTFVRKANFCEECGRDLRHL